jgi:CheY-like chemotaxis protein
VRIVAITGYGQASDKRAAMAAGFDQHLTKPVDDEVLEALIDTAGVD